MTSVLNVSSVTALVWFITGSFYVKVSALLIAGLRHKVKQNESFFADTIYELFTETNSDKIHEQSKILLCDFIDNG